MVSEQRLEEQCPPKTFQRARLIAASGQSILTKKCRFDQAGTHLSAFVASSRGWNDSYRTSITLDETRGLIKDYACTCPAAMQYDAPCKHCMALAISYSMKPERFSGYRSHRKPETTPCLAEFIKQSDIARSASFCNEIDIEPTLVYGYRAWSAHFKVIGPNGSYVMKNIADFAERMEQGAYHSYGKTSPSSTRWTRSPREEKPSARSSPEPLPRESGLHTRTHGGLGRRKCPRARYI